MCWPRRRITPMQANARIAAIGAPCPVHIDIAMVNKLYDLATMQPEVPATVRAHYESLEQNAEDCIACGGCETRCPFGVPVIERMEKAKKIFG